MEEKQNVESGITLSELFNMLLRNWMLIVLITVFATLMGVIYTYKLVEPTYVADADVMVQIDKTNTGGGSSTNDYDLTNMLRIVQTVSEFFQKPIVLEKVIAELDLNMTPKEMQKSLNVTFSQSSLFVNVEYESEDPELAVKIVNSIISNASSIANDQYSILKDTIAPLGVAENATYASPNKPLNIIVSILIGLVLGVVIAILAETLKTTIHNKKELEDLVSEYGYKVIGEIPQITSNKGVI